MALTNAGATPGAVGTTAAALGLPHSDCYRVRDLWAHAEGVGSGSIGPTQIPPHGVAMFRVSSCR